MSKGLGQGRHMAIKSTSSLADDKDTAPFFRSYLKRKERLKNELQERLRNIDEQYKAALGLAKEKGGFRSLIY